MAHSRLNAEIADTVRATAKERGLTHRDLALRVGIADRTFNRLLGGQADWSVTLVAQLEDILEAPLMPARGVA